MWIFFIDNEWSHFIVNNLIHTSGVISKTRGLAIYKVALAKEWDASLAYYVVYSMEEFERQRARNTFTVRHNCSKIRVM